MAGSQTFHDHIQELRRRLAWLVATIGISSGAGYAFRVPIMKFLQHPLGGPLFYTSPAGSFNFVLKVSTSLGIMIALPLIIYHLIRFIEPALPSPIKRSLIINVIFFATILAFMGMAFGFFVIIPMSLHFFSTYSSNIIRPMISVESYLSFVTSVLLTFALLFQIPLLILFINRIKPIKPSQLLRYQRHVIVGAFVISVVLPFTYEPITQFVMAIPIVFLYYLSILLVWLANRKVVYTGSIVEVSDVAKRDPRTVTATSTLIAPTRAQTNPIKLSAETITRPSQSLRPKRKLRLDAINSNSNLQNLLDLSNPS